MSASEALEPHLPVPTSLWTTYYVWTLYLALQIIMILQHLEHEPIKSVHWTCKLDVCLASTPSTITSFEHSFWAPQGTWKNCFSSYILPDMGHMAALRRTKRYFFKQTQYLTLPDRDHSIFLKTSHKPPKNHETRSICLFLAMFLLCWMYALLSAAPTVASTTLITQCTPYFRPIPTVLPLTFTNPSLPLSSEAPQPHLNYHI